MLSLVGTLNYYDYFKEMWISGYAKLYFDLVTENIVTTETATCSTKYTGYKSLILTL